MTATPSFLRPRTWLLAAASVAALGSLALQPAFADNDDDDDDRIKPAQIATQPLYSAMAGDRPTMLLAPSVEFPTVGLLHQGGGTAADVYSPAEAYLGYFNHEMCYEYNKGEGYFEISKKANGRKCSGDEEFSGNFLNWATASAIDMMRLALTGGDRVIDEPDRTVLQRAYLPSGTTGVKSVQLMDGTTKNVSRGGQCYWKHTSYFYTKVLKKSDGGGGYAGAIPKEMIEALDAQDASRPVNAGNAAQDARGKLFVNSIGNQIHFGAHRMDGLNGECGFGPYNYVVGAGGVVNDFHYARKNAFWPTSKHGTPCNFDATCKADDDGQRVWFGDNVAGHQWITGIVKGTFTCGGDIFKNANRHGDTGEVATSFSTASKCYLEDEDANLSGNTPFFYARVKVCDSKDERDYKDNDGNDFGYCREYPNGKKKPVGVIQKYADNLRLAAFGYLMDHTAAHGTDDYKGRFGAALRAPMKYVGPNVYGPTGIKTDSDNPRKEWDTETGVLIENPEGREEGVSGVINYFNRFGRNPTALGNYKQYDNVGEMYYEALRYLQGLPRTEEAVKYLNDYKKDGFPVYTSWDGLDPFDSELGYSPTADYACLNNSLLIIGDINTHDPVNTAGAKNKLRYSMESSDDSKNVPDFKHWRNVVLGYEIPQFVNYVDGAGEDRTTSNPLGGNAPSGIGDGTETWRNWNSFIPGMAYWAHTHDIRGKNWTHVDTNAGETAYQEKDENGNVTKSYNSKVRPGLRVTSYFFDVNEAGMSTLYTARTGSTNTDGGQGKTTEKPTTYWGNQYWLGAKYGGFKTQPDNDNDTAYNTHGNPYYDQKGNATHALWSDLKKAQGANTNGAANPEPRTYYMPADAEGVLKAFDAIFGAQKAPSNRSIAGADSSGGIGGTSFQAEFDGETWSGDVIAETITRGRGTEKVRASSALPSHEARNIIMASHGTNGSTTAFEFKEGSVPDDVRGALDGNINGVNADAADRINWLRGDRSNESALRERKGTLLGDIVNSGVKYVGAPAGQVNLGLGYANFVGDASASEPERVGAARRTAALYVGANDGMLHAFHAGGKQRNATTGKVTEQEPTLEELFAYIPSWMKGKLAALTAPDYVHQAYVDATPVIGDANLKADCTVTNSPNTGDTDCEWRSVLVGGTGGGGKGVYALNVTDPANFTADDVLWEFTDADDPDMGYVLGQARIVKLLYTEADTATNTPAVYRWFAMVPAGVNNYVSGRPNDDDDDDDDDRDDARRRDNGNGDANIFLLALDKPSNVGWGAANTGGYYWKLRLPRIQALQADYPTGILNLEAFTGLGGVTEYVYAGDLHGQLWAFKFKGTGSSDWNVMTLSHNYNGTDKIKPLFIARTPADGDGNTEPQPITVAPSILEGAGNGVHFVSFGTGKYFEPGDANTKKIDTFYTVYSNFNHSAAQILSRDSGDAIIPDRSYLQEVVKDRTESDVDYFKPSQAFFWGWRADAPSDADTIRTRSGWYMDFVERGENGATTAVGERQIADASWVSLTSRLMFSTLTPASATNTGVCGTGGGDSKLYTFDMISGMGTGRHSAVGMLAQPLVFLDTANTRETQADSTGRRLRISPVMSGQFGADGSDVSQVDTVIVPFGRLSWRRIDNFEGLRQAGGTSNPSAGGNNAGGGDSGNSNSGD